MSSSLVVPTLSRRTTITAGLGLALSAVPAGMLAWQATPAGPSSDEDLLRETETQRLRALVEINMDVAEPLHADDFQLINPAGGALSKDDYLGGLAAGVLDYLVFEPVSAIEVRLYGDAAAIRYQSNIEITVDGNTAPLATYWHTDLYEKRGGQWQVIWSQATEVIQ